MRKFSNLIFVEPSLPLSPHINPAFFQGSFIDAVQFIQFRIQRIIPTPLLLDNIGTFHVRNPSSNPNFRFVLVQCAILLQILTSLFYNYIWSTYQESAKHESLLNLLIALFNFVIAWIPLAFFLNVKYSGAELCLILNEVSQELSMVPGKYKNIKRVLVALSLCIGYTSMTSFTIPFTVPNDTNVVVLNWLLKYFLGDWTCDKSRRVLIIPVISTIAVGVSVSVLQSLLILNTLTTGIFHVVTTCRFIKTYNKIRIIASLMNQAFSLLVPVLVGVLVISSTLPVAILLSLWSQISLSMGFNVALLGGACIAALSSFCRNVGSIDKHAKNFLRKHLNSSRIIRNRLETRRTIACPPVHVRLGRFGYFDPGISLTFLDVILNNTVGVLLFLQN